MTISLVGDVILVTGGGHGLGRSHVLELARRQAAVVVNDLDGEAADAVVAEVRTAGGHAVSVCASVATAEGGQVAVEAAVQAFGKIDAIVHNAGCWRNAPLEEMTEENVAPVIDVNLRGAFNVLRPAWPVFMSQGYGRVVLTSSNASFGRAQGANYVAAKSALLGLTRAVAIEGEPYGIQANAILPVAATAVDRRPMEGAYQARIFATMEPLQGRLAPETVSPLVALLVSRECPVNGEAISAIAGRFAKVFFGVARGWTAEDAGTVDAEQLLDKIADICDIESFIAPSDVFDEMEEVGRSVAAATGGDTESRP